MLGQFNSSQGVAIIWSNHNVTEAFFLLQISLLSIRLKLDFIIFRPFRETFLKHICPCYTHLTLFESLQSQIYYDWTWIWQKIELLVVDFRLWFGFNDTSTLVGHFVSSPREREKRESRRDEREEQGRKRNRNESEEIEEIKIFPLYPYLLQG